VELLNKRKYIQKGEAILLPFLFSNEGKKRKSAIGIKSFFQKIYSWWIITPVLQQQFKLFRLFLDPFFIGF
jgi:hypothetical protein